MALFEKQDFTPPVLSKRWLTIQFRPNMLLYCQEHIITILESGLLFREDSIEIEEQVMSWMDPEIMNSSWLTTGEKVMTAVAFCATVAAFPPKTLNRWTAVRAASYLLVPAALRSLHRRRCAGSVRQLLSTMLDYLGVARRAAACCREYAALYAKLASVVSVAQSMESLLLHQQTDMVNLLSRVSAAVLGNAPWLRGDVAWEAVCRPGDSFMKIHHTFLVVQSLLLKHIAMVHYIPSLNQKKVYKNYNERIYWLHTVVIPFLIGEYTENYNALDRMYRLLKNCATVDSEEAKKPGSAIKNSWLYSEVHTEIARSSLELRIALNKSNGIDKFLDSCGNNEMEIDLEVLNEDIEDLVDKITKCLTSAQNSQKRLIKLHGKPKPIEESKAEEVVQDGKVVKLDDKVPEAKDEVFYFVKTEDDVTTPLAGDVLTAPGKKEKEASKVVLHELKRKLGKREDVMRERERQALKKTMPQYKDNVPEFPKQIPVEEYADRKGVISKLLKKKPKKRLFKQYKIGHKKRKFYSKSELKLIQKKYTRVTDIKDEVYEANEKLKAKNKKLTVTKIGRTLIVNVWRVTEIARQLDSSGISDGLSDVEAAASNKVTRQAINLNADRKAKRTEARNLRFSKKELELTTSDTEDDFPKPTGSLMDDVRRRRAFIKKRYRKKTLETEADESLKPIEYRFGTGMAMASVLQVKSDARIPTMAQEEVFIGDGEVSGDSGNNESD